MGSIHRNAKYMYGFSLSEKQPYLFKLLSVHQTTHTIATTV